MKNKKKEKAQRPTPKIDDLNKGFAEVVEKYGVLNPENAWEVARHKSSPLHKYIEWNKDKAAKEYQLYQLRKLIAYVQIDGPTGPVNKWVNVIVDSSESDHGRAVHVYIETEKGLRNAEFRDQILAQAKAEFKRLADKYRHLTDLAHVIKVVDDL